MQDKVVVPDPLQDLKAIIAQPFFTHLYRVVHVPANDSFPEHAQIFAQNHQQLEIMQGALVQADFSAEIQYSPEGTPVLLWLPGSDKTFNLTDKAEGIGEHLKTFLLLSEELNSAPDTAAAAAASVASFVTATGGAQTTREERLRHYFPGFRVFFREERGRIFVRGVLRIPELPEGVYASQVLDEIMLRAIDWDDGQVVDLALQQRLLLGVGVETAATTAATAAGAADTSTSKIGTDIGRGLERFQLLLSFCIPDAVCTLDELGKGEDTDYVKVSFPEGTSLDNVCIIEQILGDLGVNVDNDRDAESGRPILILDTNDGWDTLVHHTTLSDFRKNFDEGRRSLRVREVLIGRSGLQERDKFAKDKLSVTYLPDSGILGIQYDARNKKEQINILTALSQMTDELGIKAVLTNEANDYVLKVPKAIDALLVTDMFEPQRQELERYLRVLLGVRLAGEVNLDPGLGICIESYDASLLLRLHTALSRPEVGIFPVLRSPTVLSFEQDSIPLLIQLLSLSERLINDALDLEQPSTQPGVAAILEILENMSTKLQAMMSLIDDAAVGDVSIRPGRLEITFDSPKMQETVEQLLKYNDFDVEEHTGRIIIRPSCESVPKLDQVVQQLRQHRMKTESGLEGRTASPAAGGIKKNHVKRFLERIAPPTINAEPAESVAMIAQRIRLHFHSPSPLRTCTYAECAEPNKRPLLEEKTQPSTLEPDCKRPRPAAPSSTLEGSSVVGLPSSPLSLS